MALAKQILPLPISPLDTKADPKTSPAFDVMENVFASRTGTGQVEIRKRYGFTAMSRSVDFAAAPDLTAGVAVDAYRDELLLRDGQYLLSRSQSVGKWRRRGLAPTMTVQTIPIAENYQGETQVAYTSGVALLASGINLGTINLFALDTVTGQLMGSATSVDANVPGTLSGYAPRVVAYGTDFYLFVHNATNTISAYKIPSATVTTLPAPVTVASDSNAARKFDVLVDAANARILVVYYTNAGNTKVLIWNTNMTAGASSSHADTPDRAVAWAEQTPAGNASYIGASSASGVIYRSINTATLASAANGPIDAGATTARAVTGYVSGGAVTAYWDIPGAASYNSVVRTNGGADVRRSVSLLGRVFTMGGRRYLTVGYSGNTSGNLNHRVTAIIATTDEYPLVGALHVGDGQGSTTAAGELSNACDLGDGRILMVAQYSIQDLTTQNNGLRVHILSPTDAPAATEGAESLFIPGALLRQYDGAGCYEAGFLVYPEAPTLVAGAAGSLTPNTTYTYSIVYAWTDATGRIWRSSPSPVATVTLGGAQNSVTVTCPTLRLTDKHRNFNLNDAASGDTRISIEVYRNTATQATLRKVVTVQNSVTADTVGVVDALSDTFQILREPLYTNDGTAENIAPARPRLCHVWRNRLFVVSGANELWVSREFAEGEAPGLSDAIRMSVGDTDGAITAIADMDSALVLFCRNAIYAIAGDGPDDTGDGMYAIPNRIAADVGALSSRGVTRTPDGLMFKSARGIYLLTRGFDVQYLGAPVESHNALTVKAAVTADDLAQARFYTSDGTTLVYDWEISRRVGAPVWYTWTNQAAVCAVKWRATKAVCFLRTDGKVEQEVVGQYQDNGTDIVFRVRTSWIPIAGPHGRGRVYSLFIQGEHVGGHTVRVTPARDYGNDGTPKTALSSSTPPYRWEARMRDQKCTAVRFTIDESQVDFNSAGPRISALALLVGLMQGARPVAAAKRPT